MTASCVQTPRCLAPGNLPRLRRFCDAFGAWHRPRRWWCQAPYNRAVATAADVRIRPAREDDADDLWNIFHAVVAGRDTYAFAPDTRREEAIAYWLAP